MVSQLAIPAAAIAGRHGPAGLVELADDVAYLRNLFVNIVLLGTPERWLLVDAGTFRPDGAILRAAAARFGAGSKPAAIVLTHGHFDHVAAARRLAERWGVRIYAHVLERPYLDGSRPYPPPEPRLADGLMSLSSPLYPRGPFQLGHLLENLAEDGSLPALPDWCWLATPGHTPGHVSLWRERGRLLVAGDAFVTTGQESLLDVLRQEPEIHGPPRYFTPDWATAGRSVATLAALEPAVAVTGHGPALAGPALRAGLERLAGHFRAVAMPA